MLLLCARSVSSAPLADQVAPESVKIFYPRVSLGVGSYGAILKGFYTKSMLCGLFHKRKECALKICRKSSRDNDIDREAKIMQDINFKVGKHPHILQRLGYVNQPGLRLLVLEYCEINLFSYCFALESKPILSTWYFQLASGLCALLEAGFYHRDIKLDNVLVKYKRSGCILKLADFGLMITREELKSKGIKSAGSLGYAAPEVVLGRRGCHPRSDIWSLAVVYYEMMTRLMFLSTDNVRAPAQGMRRAYLEFFKTKKQLQRVAGHSLGPLVGRMLRYDPDQRPSIQETLSITASYLR